ncbi:hypothetical protein KR222_008964 [Zaprionus bogoriensis]|nr:hypothetical protein KR222_008964 [Zaprionus bogoriensis]
MLKIPPRKSQVQSLKPRTVNIERPNPRRRLNIIKAQFVIPQRPTRSEEIAKITAELNDRLVNLQTRVAEWKAMREMDYAQ